MQLQDRYLDRIADALEKQMQVDPKLIGGNVLKPNIYRIADALDPNPQLLAYGTVKNPLARIADAIEGGNFGGESGGQNGSRKFLFGETEPTNDIGENKDFYFKIGTIAPEYGGDVDSGLGWISTKGAICKNTDTIGIINSRPYTKATSDPAIVAFFPNAGYVQLRCASTIREGVNSKAGSSEATGSVYSYEIDGLTWYFSTGSYGFSNGKAVSNYPVFNEVYDFASRDSARKFLLDTGMEKGSYTPSQDTILDAFVKLEGLWKRIILSKYSDLA